jgi:hypothetical protein
MNIALCRNAAFAAALLSSAVGHAATDVYSQPQSGSFINTSAVLNAAGDPGFNWTSDSDEQVWAYFSLPTAVTFNRISWYGSNTDGNFAVDLFAASCFSCSANLVGGSGTFSNNLLPNPGNSGPYSQTQVHKTQIGTSNVYSYYIDLAAPVTLGTTGAYAISAINNYSTLPFLWAGSGAGSGTYLQYVVGQSVFLPAPGNLAFTLTNTTAVPEPGTGLSLSVGLGLIGLTFGRHKRLCKQARSARRM